MVTHLPSPILVIGYGNTLRSDDGVGPAVVQAISQWQNSQLQTLICHQLTPELADTIAGAGLVIFVDALDCNALKMSAPKTQLRSLDLEIRPPTSVSAAVTAENLETPSLLGHFYQPESLLHMTKWLYGHVPPAWLIAVPAVSFELGCEFSEIAIQGMQRALVVIQTLIDEVQGMTTNFPSLHLPSESLKLPVRI